VESFWLIQRNLSPRIEDLFFRNYIWCIWGSIFSSRRMRNREFRYLSLSFQSLLSLWKIIRLFHIILHFATIDLNIGEINVGCSYILVKRWYLMHLKSHRFDSTSACVYYLFRGRCTLIAINCKRNLSSRALYWQRYPLIFRWFFWAGILLYIKWYLYIVISIVEIIVYLAFNIWVVSNKWRTSTLLFFCLDALLCLKVFWERRFITIIFILIY